VNLKTQQLVGLLFFLSIACSRPST